ncbi:MAG: asparagine synthase (glutamine-hydrolyzing) [Thermodesulfobacteriota bacterium]
MCGIAGILTKDADQAGKLSPVLEQMLDLMRHRGPNDRGSLSLGGLLLGHLRLSILDLSPRGRQPMTIAGGRYVISYNGEVYNYLELRRELEARGAVFANDTDTEVILQAYAHWGLDCFRRFNGMWALAIWDREQRRLVLSRDRVGVKPLYWCADLNRLAFASEIKALASYRRSTGLPLEINPSAVETYLNSGLVDGLEDTFFHGLHRFKPGHFMVVQNERIQAYQPYWDLPGAALSLREKLAGRSQDELAGELLALLEDAVTIHTRSDVPVGVCLSGGLDSSCVAGLAGRIIPELKTFTSWFEEGDEWNELQYAERVKDKFGLQSYKTVVPGPALLEKLPNLLWYLDEPTLALGVYPQWHVMEAAAREVTVVMDGQGGDEIFAGYDFYAARLLYSRLLAGRTKDYQRTLAGYYKNYGLNRANSLGQEVKSLYLSQAEKQTPQVFPGHLDNFLFQELTQSRLPALLRYEDRLSMAFSIESRVPLLDYRLIELAFALEEGLKVGPGWSKHLLRRAVSGLLPEEIAWRKDKKGFPTPFQVWADGPLKLSIRELLLDSGGRLAQFLDRKQIKDFFAAWDKGQRNHWLLWRLLSLEVWLRSYIDRLASEMKAAPAAFKPDLAAATTNLRQTQPLEVVITVDYETFDTNDFVLDKQYRIDWDRDLIDPTEQLARLLEKHGAILTVLWDTVEYFWLVDHGYGAEAAKIDGQLQDLIRRGHDVQLHLHPAWTSVRRENGYWVWSNPGLTAPSMNPDDFEALVQRSVAAMEDLFKPIRPDYAVRGFRGRSYEVEPFGVIAGTLVKYGLRADSSYHGNGPLAVKIPKLTEGRALRSADFLEYPILAKDKRRWDFSGPPEFATLAVDALPEQLPPNPPFGHCLVMIGHSKQKINFQELENCLKALKAKFGAKLKFSRWRDSIDRRLQIMQGDWLAGDGFSSDYFDQRWQEDDPFSSQQVDDPYYRFLLNLLPEKAGSLLDLGCAEGAFTKVLAEKLGAGRVLGVDVSASAVRRAREAFPDLEFQQADMLKFQKNERFDCVFSGDNIYYFAPAERAVIFRRLESMLAEGGRMILAWWTGARRGFQEEKIEEEFRRFFKVVRAETFVSPAGARIKGEHRILVAERRLTVEEELIFGAVYWSGKRVLDLSRRSADLRSRFGWLGVAWKTAPPANGDSAAADLLITDTNRLTELNQVRPNGAIVAYMNSSGEENLRLMLGLTPVIRQKALSLFFRRPGAIDPREFLSHLAGFNFPTAVFVNSPDGADFISRLGVNSGSIQFITVREEVYRRFREMGLEVRSPLDIGYHFVFHQIPYRDAAKYVEKGSWSQGKYQGQFVAMARDSLMGNPAIRYFKGFDLFHNGDYNAACLLGQQILYPIEVISKMVGDRHYQSVVSLDGQNDQLESFILEYYLRNNQGPDFFPVKLNGHGA